MFSAYCNGYTDADATCNNKYTNHTGRSSNAADTADNDYQDTNTDADTDTNQDVDSGDRSRRNAAIVR